MSNDSFSTIDLSPFNILDFCEFCGLSNRLRLERANDDDDAVYLICDECLKNKEIEREEKDRSFKWKEV